MIVDRKSYKRDVFLRKLAKHLTLSETVTWSSGDEVWYLGGGYWRAKPVYNGDGDDAMLIGVSLINPSRTAEEIETITQAMSIII